MSLFSFCGCTDSKCSENLQQRDRKKMHHLHLQSRFKLWTGKEVAYLVVLLASPAWGQEHDAAWLKANYLPAAKTLEKSYGECSAKVERTVLIGGSDRYIKTTYHFAFDGANRKLDKSIENKGEDGAITNFKRSFVASPDVSFSVVERDGAPLLDQVNRTQVGLDRATQQIDSEAGESIYAPFVAFGWRVSEWINDKGFEIKSVKQNGDRVKLDFQYKKNDRTYVGWMSFLPVRQWAMDKWDMVLTMNIGKPKEYRWRVAATMNYGGDEPVPNLVGLTAHSYHVDRTDTENIVVDELTFAPVPASQFKLSNYGYDDRIGSPASVGRSLWFWLASAGIICLLIALGIRLRYRHALQ
jgi:hypothetical protein